MRRIRSRILYEQMLGRATRLCPDIDKEVFKIFDAVRLYEGLKVYTDMKPITVNPKTTFKQLVEELDDIKKEAPAQKQIDQILAKFQRKRKYIDKDNQAAFKFNSKNKSPEEFIQMLKDLPPAEAQKELHQYWKLWAFMDTLRPSPSVQLLSEHEDEWIGTERGYGKGEKPEDYIESFKNFITNNINQIAALEIVCKRPTSLDRQSLKELKLILDENGFNTRALNTAWKSAKNEDIAADIISYIRTLSMGSVLVSHEERIQRAIDKVFAMKTDWTKSQRNWINRFKKQLLEEHVLKAEDLEKEPFKRAGGFNKLNKVFRNDLKNILTVLNEELYRAG
jgi:type I restriction enzyme R subunit